MGWWGSIPTSFRCFRPTVLLILTALRPRDYHTFLQPILYIGYPPTCAILRTPLTFGLLQHLHNLTFLLLYAPGSCGKTSLLSDAFASILIRLPLNPVLRLFSGNRSGISQSNFYTTANTALKSDNLSEEWDSNPRSQPWQGRILPTELPSHHCDLEIIMRFSYRYYVPAAPTTCAILRTPSIVGLMHHLHDLTFL